MAQPFESLRHLVLDAELLLHPQDRCYGCGRRCGAIQPGCHTVVCQLRMVAHGCTIDVGRSHRSVAVNGHFDHDTEPVLAVRQSEADARERHRGVSHHAETVLDVALAEIAVPDAADGEGWEAACAGLALSHMGRGPSEDPAFFRAAYGAGIAARRMLG